MFLRSSSEWKWSIYWESKSERYCDYTNLHYMIPDLDELSSFFFLTMNELLHKTKQIDILHCIECNFWRLIHRVLLYIRNFNFWIIESSLGSTLGALFGGVLLGVLITTVIGFIIYKRSQQNYKTRYFIYNTLQQPAHFPNEIFSLILKCIRFCRVHTINSFLKANRGTHSCVCR